MAFPHGEDDRVVVHTGRTIEAACRATGYRYARERGVLDVVPRGYGGAWDARETSTACVLRLAPMLVQRTAEELGMDADRLVIEPKHQFRDEAIEHVAWSLWAEFRAGSPNGPLFTEALSIALAAHVLRQYGVLQQEARGGLGIHRLRRITDHIEAHLHERLTLRDIARVAGVGTTHLKVWFKRDTGFAVHEYVLRRRVERAAQLISAGKLSGTEIAIQMGFSHQSHMTRTMRRLLGTTPSGIARGIRRRHS